MKCPICRNDFHGKIKKQGIVYRKSYVKELKGDIWVCNSCHKSTPARTLLDRIKDVDPTEIYDTPLYKDYYGVGGWLLLFILTITIFSPLGGGLGFIKAYGAVSPLFNRAPIFYYFYTIAIPTIALLGFGIYAGIGLWTLKPHADKVAKRYLWSLLAWKAILLLLPTFFSLPQKLMSLGAAPISFTNIALGEGGFRIDLSPIFWLLYFNKSARVKETYHIRAKLKDLH